MLRCGRFSHFKPLSFQPRSHNEICEALASLTAFEDDTGEASRETGEAGLAEEEGMQDSGWPMAWCDGMLQWLCLVLREVDVTSPVLDVHATDPVIER